MCYRCLDREICVEQRNIYSTLIGLVFHELWQFETRHANLRNLRAFLIHIIPDPGLKVNTISYPVIDHFIRVFQSNLHITF